MKSQYDKIAKKYKKANRKSKTQKYLFVPSLFKLLGNIKNKSVLDLGCGEGYYTRLAKIAGAAKVIGIDLSKRQIELANLQEKKIHLE